MNFTFLLDGETVALRDVDPTTALAAGITSCTAPVIAMAGARNDAAMSS